MVPPILEACDPAVCICVHDHSAVHHFDRAERFEFVPLFLDVFDMRRFVTDEFPLERFRLAEHSAHRIPLCEILSRADRMADRIAKRSVATPRASKDRSRRFRREQVHGVFDQAQCGV